MKFDYHIKTLLTLERHVKNKPKPSVLDHLLVAYAKPVGHFWYGASMIDNGLVHPYKTVSHSKIQLVSKN